MSSNHQVLLGGGGVAFTPISATGGTVADITILGKSYRRHTFTGPGTFEITARGETSNNNLEVLLVAGGGSGGVDNGGGGGAGGVVDTTVTPAVQSYPITIGAGAAKRVGSADDGPGFHGDNSTAFSLTAIGGGAGTGWSNGGDNGTPGGSGGGRSTSPGSNSPVGVGTGTQPGSPSGGFGNPGAEPTISGAGAKSGGGGGAGGAASGMVGGAARATAAKYGPGIGYTGSFGTGVAGGGSGGSEGGEGQPVTSNNGVAKAAGATPGPAGPQGTFDENDCLANSGAGGHGSNHPNNLSSGAGGPGICVVRYKLET